MFFNFLSTQVFVLFFLLLAYHTLCCFAQSAGGSTNTEKGAPLFNSENVNALKSKNEDTSKENISICKIKTYSLVAAEGLMVALVKTWQTKDKGDKVNLLAKYIETGEKWGEEAIKNINSEDKWKLQLVTESKTFADTHIAKITSVANIKNNKIYIFALNNTTTKENKNDVLYEDVNITLFEGIITNKDSEPKSKTISWNNKISFKLSGIDGDQNDIKDKISKLSINDISAFVTKDDNIVLLLEMKIENENAKIITLLMDFKTSTNNVKFSYINTVDSCNPHLFLWEDKIIMMSTDCKKDAAGGLTLREFTEMKKWVNSTGPFSCLLYLLKDKKDFTPAIIGNSSLLLFTQLRKNEGTEAAESGNSHLFISDGTRVKEVGLIAAGVSETEPVRLLFTSNELFTLHKKKLRKMNTVVLF